MITQASISKPGQQSLLGLKAAAQSGLLLAAAAQSGLLASPYYLRKRWRS